jgi:hypothetical protein
VEMVGGHPLLIQTSYTPSAYESKYLTIAYWYLTPDSGIRLYGYDSSVAAQRVTLAILRTLSTN